MKDATAAAAAPAPMTALRAGRSTRAWILLIVVACAALAADLAGKALAFHYVAGDPVVLDRELIRAGGDPIPPHSGVHVLPASLLDLRLVINRGAVFGIGPQRRVFLIVFTLVALVAATYLFARRTTARDHLAHVAIALIMAGGTGNLYDRIVYGVVRDFLHLLPGWHLPFGWRYPSFLGGGSEVFPWVFNFADAMLLTGMGLLILHLNRQERRQQKAVSDQQSEVSAHVPPPDTTISVP